MVLNRSMTEQSLRMVPLAKALVDPGRETLRQLRSPTVRRALRAELRALASALARAHWLWHAVAGRQLSFDGCLEHWASVRSDVRAISDENESLSYSELLRKVVAGAAALQDLGVERGTRVAIVAENSVTLVVTLFATERAGGVALLVDPRESTKIQDEIIDGFDPALILVEGLSPPVPIVAVPHRRVVELSALAKAMASRAPRSNERSHTSYGRRPHASVQQHSASSNQPFAVLATSGTTGTPKLIRISNARAVTSGFGIAGFCLALTRNDSIFCMLPLSHATALLTALCPAIVSGCALVVRRRFTPESLWADVAASRATCLLYVGELARALLCAPSRPKENEHTLRVAYGNGLKLRIWHGFQARFRIPRIVEYYGATELPLALVNLAGEPGFMGRSVLRRLSPWRVVARDADNGQLERDSNGACVSTAPGQTGELLLLTRSFSWRGASSARAHSDTHEHMRDVTHVVFPGDAAIRTGDIVVRDADGYFRFVDRTFEMFRQLGHNVSTRRLAEVLERCTGVSAAGVTHLTLEHYDGQLGLAVIVPTRDFDLALLAKFYEKLAPFERPRFLRVAQTLRQTRSLKFDHACYRQQGVNPGTTDEPTFVFRRGSFEAVTPEIWAQIAAGRFRF